MRMPMRRCRAASLWARCTRCLRRPAGRAPRRPALSPGSRDGWPRGGRWCGSGRISPKLKSGAVSMSGLAELGLDPRLLVTRARRRCGPRAADGRRRAGLRCGRRRRAGSLGRGAAARSRRQPQADIGGAGLRRDRPGAADGGGAAALDGRDQMDRARGAFAAGARPGAHGARRCSMRSLSATVMARSAAGSWNGNVMSAFSENRRRILSLWLPRLPIDRIKRQRLQQAYVQAKKTALRLDNAMNPASSLPSKTTRCRFSRSTMRPRISVSRSACRSPMPAPSAPKLQVYRCR